ncbi:MAG: dimethylsulfonioproprionate lyase family protein [Roseovarius sp.]
MSRTVWDTLLQEARAMHTGSAALQAFCTFPTDLTPQDITAHQTSAAGLFAKDTALDGSPNAAFQQALITATPHARWQELYKDTDIGEDFLSRFGFTCLIGDGGAFDSPSMGAWLLYMPAHLHYTWHHHLADEMYLVVAGSARFMRDGAPDETLTPGQTMLHQSNQPHAMETGDSPVLCYIIWRDHFEHLPVLSQPEDFQ